MSWCVWWAFLKVQLEEAYKASLWVGRVGVVNDHLLGLFSTPEATRMQGCQYSIFLEKHLLPQHHSRGSNQTYKNSHDEKSALSAVTIQKPIKLSAPVEVDGCDREPQSEESVP